MILLMYLVNEIVSVDLLLVVGFVIRMVCLFGVFVVFLFKEVFMFFVVILVFILIVLFVGQDFVDWVVVVFGFMVEIWVFNFGVVVDIFFDGQDVSVVDVILCLLIVEQLVDLFVQLQFGWCKVLLIVDMDFIMICQECIDELVVEFGLKDKILGIIEWVMCGEIVFELVLREWVGLFKGLFVLVIDKVLSDWIIFMFGGCILVQIMKVNGVYCVFVFGGFIYFIWVIVDMIGFDDNWVNIFLEIDGVFSGIVVELIFGKDVKWVCLEELVV